MGLRDRLANWFQGTPEVTSEPAPGIRAEITTSKELEDVFLAAGLDVRSGVNVTPEGAVGVAAVAAAAGLISETVAQIPLLLLERTGERGKRRAIEHPFWRILHTKPNSFQNSFEFRELMTLWMVLHGNAYALKNRARGQVMELLPIHPTRVEPEQQDDFRVIYKIRLPNGERVDRPQRDVIHLRDRSMDGVVGQSRVRVNREAIGLTLRMEHYGANFFGNSARPSGVLSTEQTLKPEQIEQIRSSWKAAHGDDNAFGTAVVDGGLQWKPLNMNSTDAQYLENRKFQIAEVARIWRVPPHMLGDLERATFSNIEQQSIEFVKYTLMPWLRRWESALNTQMLGSDQQDLLFFEYLVEGLMRGTTKERFESYQIGVQNGWMTRNEVRERENLDPVDGGDEITPATNIFQNQEGSDEDDQDT